MTYELSVVAPCFNEEASVEELTERLCAAMAKKGIRGQVVLVNDGSWDETPAKLDMLAARYEQVVAVHHATNQGMEGGWATGVATATGEHVCLIDADLQNLPEDVPRLYRELLRTGADVVQGSRSSVGRLRDERYLQSKALNTLLNGLFGMHLRDNKSGFVVARRSTLIDILRHEHEYEFFQTFIAISAASKGYRIHEVETLFEKRLAGKSFLADVPLRAILGVLSDLPKALVEFRLHVKTEGELGAYLQANPPIRRDAPLTGWRKSLMDAYFATMPLHKWKITRRAKTYYEELKRSQWLSPEQIREVQNLKLARLVEHAYRHVAFYRERMDALGLKPSDIQTVADLAKLPLLTKDDVRENLYFDLMSDNHNKRKILKVNTSGSTGEPFTTYADTHQLEMRWAATLRSMEWTGYRFGDRQARLWHQTLGMSWDQRVRERIDAWFNRRMFIPAYSMKEDQLDAIVERLRAHKPRLIDGYAESFNMLAEYVKQNQLEGFDVAGIVSSAQVLPENSRSLIETGFGTRVFDKYGAREFSGIAYECEMHEGHHIVAESYFVEILCEGRPAKPGELGEVVITDLSNLCVPLIRYRIGDLAVAMDDTVPCRCGRGLPRIGRIEGRVQAIIRAEDGTLLPGTFFAHFFKEYAHVVRQYQVVQERPGAVALRIIKGRRFTDEGFGELMTELRKYVGRGTEIDVQFVEDIPLVRTGKHQGSISLLKIDFQDGKSVAGGAPASRARWLASEAR